MDIFYKTRFRIICQKEQAAVTTGHKPWSANYLTIIEYIITKGKPVEKVVLHQQWFHGTVKDGVKLGKEFVRSKLKVREAFKATKKGA